MSRKASKSGFTLLEIILSISLLALMALMILQVFSAGTKAVEQGKSQTLLDEAARSLLDMLERDVSQALVRTDVPFRVETAETDPFNTLYFISTGVRRNLESIPRDTAPLKYTVSKNAQWNQALQLETPYGSAGTTPSTLGNLSEHSDYYFSSTDTAADFSGVKNGGNMRTVARSYTELLDTYSSDYAMLTTFRIFVNGDSAWTGNAPSGTPDADDLPRFVDIRLGLAPASTVRQARELDDAGNTTAAEQLILQHERMYTRRFFMPNTGIEGQNFQ